MKETFNLAHLENLLYMSVRYAVGRSTINCHYHASDIIKYSAPYLDSERKARLGREIHNCIRDVLSYGNVHFFDFVEDRDVFTPIMKAIQEQSSAECDHWACEVCVVGGVLGVKVTEDVTSNLTISTLRDLEIWAAVANYLLGVSEDIELPNKSTTVPSTPSYRFLQTDKGWQIYKVNYTVADLVNGCNKYYVL